MEKRKNIPELRFPGFDQSLSVTKITNIAEVKTGDKDTKNKVDDGLYPFFVRSDNVERINSFSFDGESILTSGDGVGVGKNFHYINGKFDFHQRVYSIRRFDREVYGKYIYYVFSEKFYKRVIKLSAKNSVDSVRMDMIAGMTVILPTLSEQQKIATFLSVIDQRISQLKKKRDLLEQYKKGVMQQIFSRQIRFKDDNGLEFPQWQKKRLGDLGKTYNGLTGKTKEDFGIGESYIQYKQIFDDSRIEISKFGKVDIKPGEKQNKALIGDVFFTVSSETPNEVGMASVLLDEVNELYLNSFCFGYRVSTDLLNPLLSRYLFRSEIFRRDIIKLAQGSTRYNMSKGEFLKLETWIPSIPEQTKIANYLSAIDDKIQHTKQQIERTQLWKKGLMQKMFV